jgi:hypothetical protein
MDLRRLRAGEWIAALSGTALLVSLFLPWYGGDVSAFQALAISDVILALIAAAAMALLIVTATQGVPAVPVAFAGLVTFSGILAVILVAVRVVWLPDLADGREWGLWLGLAAATGVGAGGWIAVRDERLSRPGAPTDATGRPVPPPPEIDPLPAPRR